ncbi:CDP-diacylglycerol--glycerol-3-phosphate 3-phosphatidyltransferase [Arsenicicoccus dermatophilus]|uniref:CDP-diacylglycerol--glycerol-3-phosphate 3-phosphatidyltransferase n=1 Tax=Arsenicicoccus dermatophilus TaxID=1076331 RepID=UPI001F4CD8F6|nr:CDP-diacylglycerol--glycerol-3-phosphate 3-phosphatidyltransferase [Arsenicicoccus dermatophilus]MCH8612855.1 CDP-diacylglycerol--glycerol-3-phosphate 3-phosphatidyltransferase [Arsenicicoccus dermatophilus]
MSFRHTPTEQPTRQVSAWNIANALTVLRILLVPVFVWLLMRHHGTDVPDRWWAFGVFVLASLTDKVDGDIARSRGLITDFGKLADPIADKALMGAGLICLSLLGLLWWWVTIVILVRELGITVMRFVVKRYGVMAASRGGKLKTTLQAIALGMYLVPGPTWWLWLAGAVMAAALAVTVVTGVDYVLAARRLRAEGRRG